MVRGEGGGIRGSGRGLEVQDCRQGHQRAGYQGTVRGDYISQSMRKLCTALTISSELDV